MKVKQTQWQLIFEQSKVNGGQYTGDELEPVPWSWPTGTWLQKRRFQLKGILCE